MRCRISGWLIVKVVIFSGPIGKVVIVPESVTGWNVLNDDDSISFSPVQRCVHGRKFVHVALFREACMSELAEAVLLHGTEIASEDVK